jgi:hypothetical protein
VPDPNDKGIPSESEPEYSYPIAKEAQPIEYSEPTDQANRDFAIPEPSTSMPTKPLKEQKSDPFALGVSSTTGMKIAGTRKQDSSTELQDKAEKISVDSGRYGIRKPKRIIIRGDFNRDLG